MLRILEPLHAMMVRGPQTLKETSFNQTYGRDLNEAQEWCQRYKVNLFLHFSFRFSHKFLSVLQLSSNIRDLNQAWDLYYHVFRRISRQLPQLTSLELQYVSPNLLVCQDLELAVPGSYCPGQPVVRIAHFHRSLEVGVCFDEGSCFRAFSAKRCFCHKSAKYAIHTFSGYRFL